MKHKFEVNGVLYRITFEKHAAMVICTIHEHYEGNVVTRASATCSPYDAMLLGIQYGLVEGMREFWKRGKKLSLTRALNKTFSRGYREEIWHQILPEHWRGFGRI